jgi:transposase
MKEADMSWHRGQAFGQDLRDRVLSASGSASEVAQRFQVSSSYVRGVRERQHQGQSTPGAQCNHVPSKLAGLDSLLQQKVNDCCDLTLAKLCEWVLQTHAIRVGKTTMFKALRRAGLTLKKRPYLPQSAHGRTSRGLAKNGLNDSQNLTHSI